jgi:glutamate dehydrogenase
MQAHRLRREIIATVLANRLIDAGGPLMLLRLRERTNADNAAICLSFETARILLDLPAYRDAIHALDNKINASAQTDLQQMGADAIAEVIAALLRQSRALSVREAVDTYLPAFDILGAKLADTLCGFELAQLRRRMQTLSNASVPEELATRAALMPVLPIAIDIAAICTSTGASLDDAFATYLKLGDALRLDRLRAEAARNLDEASYWERLATRRLIEDLRRHQAEAAAQALGAENVDAWLGARDESRKLLIQQLNALSSSKATFAQFTLAADAVRGFMSGSI